MHVTEVKKHDVSSASALNFPILVAAAFSNGVYLALPRPHLVVLFNDDIDGCYADRVCYEFIDPRVFVECFRKRG